MVKILAYDLHRVKYPIHPAIKQGFEKQGFSIINYAKEKIIPPCDHLIMVGLPDPEDYETFKNNLSLCKHKSILSYTRINFYQKKECGTDKRFYELFDEQLTITTPGCKRYAFLIEETGLPVRSTEINFFDWDTSEPKPLTERNNNIVYFGRLMTFKGTDCLLEEREIIASKYNLVVYGLSWFSKTRNGAHSFAMSDLHRYTKWGEGNKDRSLKDHVFGHSKRNMYNINYKFEPGGLNLCGKYDLKKIEPIFRLSRYALFPYLYKSKSPDKMLGVYDMVPEFTILEAINLGIPVITTTKYAKNFHFNNKKKDLRECFITFNDTSEINEKCAEYEKNYDVNVKHQKEFWMDFYKNSDIEDNLLYGTKKSS